MPSKTGEGFPMVVVEAFASGLPVICTNTGGQIELLKIMRLVLLLNPTDQIR